MATLQDTLRKKLEKAVAAARDVAEEGARTGLKQLTVHAPEPDAHLSPDHRELRVRLRAHARQLGDGRDARTGAHQIDRLVVECAYEHWHRMLFARFLAENGVLMHPDGVAVTLDECEELAEHEDAANGWELAGRYASRMLPQIFRPNAPVLAVELPPEQQRQLEKLLADLAPETFKASDALGWVYQFWQAKKKEEVNKSEVKIGADELPAVTQLFTEPYMVEFLLHNTLGAWWAGKVLAKRPELAATAESEEELRAACALPGYEWTYLRFVREAEDGGLWRPAAGTFEGWPKKAADIKVLDPCCGSGHFLVAAFQILVKIRMVEEALGTRAAGDAVLRDNLYGVELDPRCTEIAAFALALAAWVNTGSEWRGLPELQIACSGLAPRVKKADWLALTGEAGSLRIGMERLYELFKNAPALGSLLDPGTVGLGEQQLEVGVASYEELEPILAVALQRASGGRDLRQYELGVTAQGILTAATVLSGRYSLVVTNVPYLARGKQSPKLQKFCKSRHGDAKQDLATVMFSRLLALLTNGGTCAAVLPQNSLFLTNYAAYRRRLLRETSVNFVIALGPAAFHDMNWWAIKTMLFTTTRAACTPGHTVTGIDLGEHRDTDEKAFLLIRSDLEHVRQSAQLDNPDSRISLHEVGTANLLAQHAAGMQGIATADYPRFGRCFWELRELGPDWLYQHSTVNETVGFGGLEHVLLWENGEGALAQSRAARIQGLQAWGRRGVVVSQMRDLPTTHYLGYAFDNNCAAIVPRSDEHLPAIWCFCSSSNYVQEVRKIDQAVKVTNATLVKVPFDLNHWEGVAAESYPDGLPEPHSENPTQWIFKGTLGTATEPLHVAAARFLGFSWPEQAEDGLSDSIDDDGISCIPSVRGEAPAADRLKALLAAAYGDDWTPQKRDELLAQVGATGKGFDWWLRHKFFEQHCKLFHHRPFIWHVWDGLKRDGFGALVNYHKLDRKLLETLAYTYLADWIKRQHDDAARNVDGASDRYEAARTLQKRLGLILEGEEPYYDVFVRWKPLREQPVGWEPDLNDGVRLNIRPFLTIPDVGAKGAGVLRFKPNVKWTKDRGRDTEDAPWYHLGPEYGGKEGDRINDHHLSLEAKRRARRER